MCLRECIYIYIYIYIYYFKKKYSVTLGYKHYFHPVTNIDMNQRL